MNRAAWVVAGAVVLGLTGLPSPALDLPPVFAQRKPQPKVVAKDEKAEPDRWEARLADGKVVAVEPGEESLKLETKFGTVTVPMKEVKRLEFGLRLNDADRKKIADAVADVVGGNARTREAGKDTLLGVGVAALPAVSRAAAAAPKEAAPHLTQVADKLKKLLGEDDDEPQDRDVILTADGSRLVGTLAKDAVRVTLDGKETALRWKDARALQFGKLEKDEKVEVIVLGAGGIHGLMTTHFEKVVGVEVTGITGSGGWGVNPYTTDSPLAAAAVHAGALKEGETGVVKIRVKADLGGYAGSTQNGVTTSTWGAYQGCYEIIVTKKKK